MQQEIEQLKEKRNFRSDTVLIYGSGQCDQFGIALNQDEQTIFEKPRIIDSKLFNGIQIERIACGGMHTLLLTKRGILFSWGCNDDFALGRQQDSNNLIKKVDFEQPISDVSAGDSHSVAYSDVSKKLYIWGQYRNIISGNIGDKTAKPTLVQEHFMKNLKIKGIASGSHHTLIHAGNKIYSWGDPESGAIGRKINTRGKNSSCLRIQAVQAKNPVAVWAGSLCSFYKDESGKIYAFGSNNYGQLGIGNLEDKYTPTLIPDFQENHHTLALSEDGEVYVWGRNDDHQLGLNINQGCVKSPTKLKQIDKIAQIKCGNHFSFALSSKGALYSWGAGDQYVLGNQSQQTERQPFQIQEQFFPKDFNIKYFASGAQHVVVVGSSDQESIMNFNSLKNEIEEIQQDIREVSCRKKITSQDLKKELAQNAQENVLQKQKLGFFVSMSQKLEANRQGGYSGVIGKTSDQLDELYKKQEEQRKVQTKKQTESQQQQIQQKKDQVKSCGFFVNSQQKQKANSKGTYLGVKGFSESQLNEIYEKEQQQRAAKQKQKKIDQGSPSLSKQSPIKIKNPFQPSSNPFKASQPSQNPFNLSSNNTINSTTTSNNPFSVFKSNLNTQNSNNTTHNNKNPFSKFTFNKQ